MNDSLRTPKQTKIALFFLLFPLLGVIFIWCTADISSASLLLEVPTVFKVEAFENRWLYFSVLAFSFIPVFFLSFDRRVHYYTSWKKLFPTILIVAIPFIIWDMVFTKWRVWGFNPKYHQDFAIWQLPIEEILFFIVIPFSSFFIYQCLKYYFPKDRLTSLDQIISVGGGGLLLLAGIIFYDKVYTSTTFLLTGGIMIAHHCYFKNTYRTRFYLAYLITWIPFLLVDGVLTGGYSDQPVVIYHPEAYLDLRITSVPLEDSIYGLLLLLLNVSLFHQMRGENIVR